MYIDQECLEVIDMITPSCEDIVMNHSVFMQCFLPIRALPLEIEHYTTQNGKVSLTVSSGVLIYQGQVQKMEVPAGAKARLILSYINHHCYHEKTDAVSMGKSLHKFMIDNNIPIGGQNLKESRRQIRNISSANITLGLWKGEGRVLHRFSRIVSGINMALEDNKFDWGDIMYMHPDYMESIREHGVPADMRILVALSKNPRAMDIYCWLTYRAPRLKYPLKISYAMLKEMFGHGIRDLRNFKIHFKKSLALVMKYYDYVIVNMENNDYIIIHPSFPSIPRECVKSKIWLP